MTDNTEVKTEPELIDPILSPKRGRGRPRVPDALRKVRTIRKAAPRPEVDNKDKLQCFRCIVWLEKDKFKLKRSGLPYKNCLNCLEYMKRYRTILKARATKTE